MLLSDDCKNLTIFTPPSKQYKINNIDKGCVAQKTIEKENNRKGRLPLAIKVLKKKTGSCTCSML